MSIMKVIEVLADSPTSWEDATKNAVKEAAKSVKHIKSVWVKDFSTTVENGEVKSFRVAAKITFKVDK